MGSCYSGDHSLETTCTQTYYNVTLRKHNRSTASERSVKEYCFGRGGGGGGQGANLALYLCSGSKQSIFEQGTSSNCKLNDIFFSYNNNATIFFNNCKKIHIFFFFFMLE